jgi:signal transduction histidine kinase
MSIIQKMLLTLLLIALAPAFVVGSIFYFNTESSLQQRQLDKLTAIATIQQSRVEVLIDQNKEILGRLNNRLSTRQAMDHYNRTQNGGDKAALQQFATDTQASVKGFKAVSVLSPAGEVVASSRSAMVGKNYASEAFFARGKVENDVTSNFFLGADGQLGLYLVGPLKLDGRLVGVSVVEWDASGLIAAAKDYTGLGETGEIVLVKRDDNGNAEYIAPLRFDATAALRRAVPLSGADVVAARGLTGEDSASTSLTDYRGRPVFAAIRYIPEAGWGLAAKIDQDEALRPLAELGNLFIVVMFILSVVIIFVAFYLARSLNEPVLDLAVAADKIRSGDLSARADVLTKDEIGQLAGTFNAMASNYEKVDQMKSEFVLLTSHQLRTPATAVKGFISMLLDGYAGKLHPKQKELIEAAYGENERQISVINSILDVAKLEAGEMVLARTTRDVAPIVEASAAGQASLLASKGQRLNIIKPKQPVMLWVDAEKLQLVIDNFIHNAIKYSPAGTAITVELKRAKSRVIIRVSDQGIGIASKDLHRLFKRFSRIASPQTANVQGAGLGLYLADKLVALHGGSIRVQSREGKGTTFTIELPTISKEDS